MNLIADIGNTSAKLAVYDAGKKVFFERISEINREELGKILSTYKISKSIICSVREIPQTAKDLLFDNVSYVHYLTHESALPFIIDYKTPETLGPDRLAAIAGAYNSFPGASTLVIDAGSAITYDFIIGDHFIGGNISPGMAMRFKALNHFTGKLPLVEASAEFTSPGRNTIEAINAGVISGVVYEINEYIRTFEKKHQNLKIILTGGDGAFLRGKISFEVLYMPDIVTDGLNYILEYNAK